MSETETNSNPLVSVIIPTFNRAGMIAGTLDSIREQAHRPIEILVVDDGSTDDTEARVEEFVSRIPSGTGLTLRYFKQENRGVASARNQGLKQAQGAYIQYLDSDDSLLPDKVSTHAGFLESHPDFDVVYGPVRAQFGSGETEDFGAPIDEDHPERQIADHLFAVHAPLFRAGPCLAKGFWNENLISCEDWEYFSRFKTGRNRLKFLPEVCATQDRGDHPSITSNRDARFYLASAEAALVVRETCREAGIDIGRVNRQIAERLFKNGVHLARIGEVAHAKKFLSAAKRKSGAKIGLMIAGFRITSLILGWRLAARMIIRLAGNA
ncbi:MAG: glycosyltransferase involved in cell wall biosynthesis [Verrucomicrobiales bacterium]|jgi:glycosyltransferase involved in cell wall biosynthesis